MYYFYKILIILSFFVCSSTALEIKNLSEAVNIAGKQRMFTQRMLKDYAMIGMGNSFANPNEDLKKVIDDFQNHMESLYSFTNDQDIKMSIDQIKELWIPIKQELSKKPTKDSAKKLQESLENLLQACDTTTKLFAKQTGAKSGKIINISGRQRMLSQKMASLYMMRVWGIDDPKFKQKMDASMKLFKDSLGELVNYEQNTPQISKLLKRVERSFMFFEIMNRSKSKFIPSLIYKKSNDILKDMNSVTGLYASIKTDR